MSDAAGFEGSRGSEKAWTRVLVGNMLPGLITTSGHDDADSEADANAKSTHSLLSYHQYCCTQGSPEDSSREDAHSMKNPRSLGPGSAV